MPTIQYGSKSVTVPDGLTDEQQWELLNDESEGVKTSSTVSNPMLTNIPVDYEKGGIDPSILINDEKYKDSSRRVYKMHHGVDWDGTEQELVDYGLNQTAQFKYNTVGTFLDVGALSMATQEEKESWLYLHDTYDKTGYSWAGSGRFLKAVAMDPATYIGLGTLGIGLAAKGTAEKVSQAAIRSAIVASIETGMQGATQGRLEQEAYVQSGRQTEADNWEVAKDAVVGAAVGGVIGGGLGAAAAHFFPKDANGVAKGYDAPAGAAEKGKAGIGTTPADLEGEFAVDLGSKLEKGSKQERAGAELDEKNLPKMPEDANHAERDALYRIHEAAKEAGEPVDLAKELDVIRKTGGWVEPRDVKIGDTEFKLDDTKPRDQDFEGLKVTEDEKSVLESIKKEADGAAGPKVDYDKELADLRTGYKPVDLLKDIKFLETDPAEKVLGAIRDISPESGPTFKSTSRKELDTEALFPAHKLINLTKAQTVDLVTELLGKALTPEQGIRLHAAFKVATNQMEAKAWNLHTQYALIEDAAEKAKAWKELSQVEKLRDNIKAGDTYLSSLAGANLGQREGSINTGKFRGMSEDTLLEEAHGDAQLIKDMAAKGDVEAQQKLTDAKNEYYRRVSDFYDRAAHAANAKEIKRQLDTAVNDFFKGAGEFKDIMELYKKLHEERIASMEQDASEWILLSKEGFNRVMNDANRVIISTVFSPATLVVNTIPSLVKTITFPALNAIVQGPHDEKAIKEMLTFYHVMYNNIGTSFQMFKAAWELERSLMMTEDHGNRFMEGAQGTGILDNRFGRYLNFFPRVLTATDEFFYSMNYRGYVMGEAHHAAIRDTEKYIKDGTMTKAEQQDYVIKKLQQTSDGMFANVQDKAKLLEWTTEVGRERGFKGQELDDWVQKQLTDRGHLMQEATSESGRRYVDDLLFKRKFSGNNLPSSAAQFAEKSMNENPWLRTTGQLFFRTPVRVFEEAARMTPGLQLFAPNFLNDLRGLNGMAAQVKATRESMLSFSFTMWAMAQFAAGNITGGGPVDYKRRRDLEASGWKPYTLKTPLGELNYRNGDPFFTPMKMIVTMMERGIEMQRQKMTGAIEPGSTDEYMAMFGATVGAVMQGIKDANLWDGINQGYTALEKSINPEHSGMDNFFVHFFGPKAAYLVPSVVSKTNALSSTQMPNPASIEQYVRAKWDANDPKVAHIHDVLGNVRVQSNPLGRLIGVDIDDAEMRKAGRSDKEMEVVRGIAQLGDAKKTNFSLPTKDEHFMPGVGDLRTTMTADGKNTLYDRINQYVKQSNITDELHIMLNKPASLDARLQGVRQIISAHRMEAFARLWQEEKGYQADFVKKTVFEAQGKAGFRDRPNALPYLND